MTRFLLTCATLISVVLLPVPTMSKDITVVVHDLERRSIADADRFDNLNSQIQISVTGIEKDGKETRLPTESVPDRISKKISIPDAYTAVKLVISDATGDRVTATVDSASNIEQTIEVAMPEKKAADQSPPMYYAVCPPPVVQCVPIRCGARHCWFRHR